MSWDQIEVKWAAMVMRVHPTAPERAQSVPKEAKPAKPESAKPDPAKGAAA